VNMKRCILFSLMFLLYGCIPQKGGIETPVGAVVSPVKTPKFLHETELPPATTSSLEPSFSVTKSCPLNRYVLDKYSGFSSDASLVVLIGNKLAILNITTGTTEIYYQITIDRSPLLSSPDAKHLAYLSVSDNEKILWTFTPSTESSPKSFSIPSETVWISWIANDKIALWDRPDSYGCLQYSGFFDLKTESVTRPANRIPELDPTKCRLLPFISEDGLRALYPWRVQDLITGATYEIRFIDSITTDPPLYSFDWTDDSISIVSFKENKLSYVVDLPISGLNDQHIKLQTIQLPAFATKGYYWILPTIGKNIKQFGWDLIERNTEVSDYVDPNKGNLPTNFYMIHLDTNQFTNYCLDRGVPFDPNKVNFVKPVQQGYFSPDDKYLAWTIYSTAEYTPPMETHVLDLETGIVIVIKDLEVFGWVIP